ncbi:hypothetical protein ACIBF1_22855 [Spirillospora sp. NPDC050679]
MFACWFDSSQAFAPELAEQAFTPTSSAASVQAASQVAARYYRDPRTLTIPRPAWR